MEHEDLVREMSENEKRTPLERIQLAKERRAIQLLRWYERQDEQSDEPLPKKTFKLRFKPNITLLESTSRNDVEEGT